MPLKKSVGKSREKRDRSWESSENGKASARRYYRKSPKAMYSLYKKSAKHRSIVFGLSLDRFVQEIMKPCVYCGALPSESESNRNGLDRVHNELGYMLSNVVPCCFPCNQMKGKLSKDEFLNHVGRIVNHAIEKV